MSVYNNEIQNLIERMKKATTPAELLNLAKEQVVLMRELATSGVKTTEEIEKEVAERLAEQCEPTAIASGETKSSTIASGETKSSTIWFMLLGVVAVVILLFFILRKR